MGYTIVAVVLGLVAGLAAGGRPANVTRRPLRAVGALGAAVVLQAIPELLDVHGDLGLTLVLASYALLVGFGLANVHLVGMPVVLVGLGLNVAVITANGGMPVREEAIRAVGVTDIADIDFGAKRHLERPDDRLTFLGDVVPVRPTGEVLSFGDLVLAAGVANVVFRLLRPPRLRRRSHPLALPPGPAPEIDLVEPDPVVDAVLDGAAADAAREPDHLPVGVAG